MRATKYPSLRHAKMIAVDIETYDPDLKQKGPGPRRDGYIVGVSIATDDGFSDYYPVRHEGGCNLDDTKVFAWLRKQFANTKAQFVGANLLYDFDFLYYKGVVTGSGNMWRDVLIAESLIDENKPGQYSLDAISRKYIGDGKQYTFLEEACARRGYKGDPRQHIWKLPANEVRSYAIGDATLPLRILAEQQKIIASENLEYVFNIESRLTPLLLYMRQIGVRIDERRLKNLITYTKGRLTQAQRALNTAAGETVRYWANASVAKAFDKSGLKYPRTAAGQPSFTRPWLLAQAHPLPKAVARCRAIDKFLNTFLIRQIKEQIINGRIHCQFNQSKSDEFGTVTGRFSSSNPNLQFIPSRDPELGPKCRALFIPEEGHLWGKADYSQIEFRISAHYAAGKSGERFRDAYNKDPYIDYHQWCADESGFDRRKAKNLNFGVLYGIGVDAIAHQFNVSLEEAKQFLARYHKALPFARETMAAVSRVAESRGWIKTISGRRRRFTMWEAADWNLAKSIPMSSRREVVVRAVNEAIYNAREIGADVPRSGVRRAKTWRALNALIQGSAADVMKKAMIDIWENGFAQTIIPHLTVHDELDCSVPDTEEGKRRWVELQHMMCDAIPMRVPIIVDATLARNWGGLK